MAGLCAAPYPATSAGDSLVGGNWSGWQVMFKSGNMDLSQGICPETGLPLPPASPDAAALAGAGARAPGFNK